MRNISMARSHLERARRRLWDAKRALDENYIPDGVRYSQECLEIMIKGIFRLVGIEYPKVHDLSSELRIYSNLFPDWFSRNLPWISELMEELAKSRGLALYGDEEFPQSSYSAENMLKMFWISLDNASSSASSSSENGAHMEIDCGFLTSCT